MKLPKIDIGLVWAKYVNIWGQLGSVAGTVNFLMMIGVFYTTTLKPNVDIPLWLYVLVMSTGVLLAVAFIVKIGISGYYRFFSNSSELSEAHRRIKELESKLATTDSKIDLIIRHFNITDKDNR